METMVERFRWDGEDETLYCRKCNIRSDTLAKSIYIADGGDGTLKDVINRAEIEAKFQSEHKDC